MNSSEGFPGKNSNRKESPQPTPGRDRREFLVALSAALGLAAWSPKDVFGATEQKTTAENRAGNLPAAPAEPVSALETPVEVFTEDEVRKMIMSDDFERLFLITSDAPNRLVQITKGSKFRTELNIHEYNQALPIFTGYKEGFYAHTHALSGYEKWGYSPARIQAIREGKKPLPHAMPPGIGDLRASIKLDKYNSEGGPCIQQRIYGTDGIYEFDGGSSSLIFVQLTDYDEEVKKLTPLLSGDPKGHKLKLEDITKKYATALKWKYELSQAIGLIIEPASHELGIKKYTAMLNKEGFNIAFRPYTTH